MLLCMSDIISLSHNLGLDHPLVIFVLQSNGTVYFTQDDDLFEAKEKVDDFLEPMKKDLEEFLKLEPSYNVGAAEDIYTIEYKNHKVTVSGMSDEEPAPGAFHRIWEKLLSYDNDAKTSM